MISDKYAKELYRLTKAICASTVFPDNFEEMSDEDKKIKKRDVPTEDTLEYAERILRIIGVDDSFVIFEIPLCWDDQVCINFGFDLDPDTQRFFLYTYVPLNRKDLFCVELEIEEEGYANKQAQLFSFTTKINVEQGS